MNQAEYRHEYKHVIDQLDCHALRLRVKTVMRLDENAGEDGRYHVRSLYFDNDGDKALKEKLNGLPNREKYRLRIYNFNGSCVRLEKKSKTAGLCQKRTAMLTNEQARRLLAGDTAWMPRADNALLAEFYAKLRYERLRPKTLVDYFREAYVFPYGNVRVTFDSDVRTAVYATGLFDASLPTLAAGEKGLLLLEVKYDRFLPDIVRDIVQTNTRQSRAFSKYAACRIYG